MTRLTAGLGAGLMALSLALAVAPQVAAQDQQRQRQGQRGGQQRGQMLERMKEEVYKLNLTDAQKPKVDKLFTDTQAEMQKLRQSGASQEENRTKMRETMMKFRTDLNAILTADQQKKLEEATPRRGRGGGQGRPGGQRQRGPRQSNT